MSIVLPKPLVDSLKGKSLTGRATCLMGDGVPCRVDGTRDLNGQFRLYDDPRFGEEEGLVNYFGEKWNAMRVIPVVDEVLKKPEVLDEEPKRKGLMEVIKLERDKEIGNNGR